MTNLGQVCPFSNVNTTHLFSGVGVGSVSWEHLFFYWFQGRNLLVDDRNLKRGGDIKEGGSNIKGEPFFFFFYQSTLMSHLAPVIPVSPDTTLKERCLG